MSDHKQPYPIFQEPGVLTDDTVLTGLGAGMTVKQFDDLLFRNFQKNLEAGNEIMERYKGNGAGTSSIVKDEPPAAI